MTGCWSASSQLWPHRMGSSPDRAHRPRRCVPWLGTGCLPGPRRPAGREAREATRRGGERRRDGAAWRLGECLTGPPWRPSRTRPPSWRRPRASLGADAGAPRRRVSAGANPHPGRPGRVAAGVSGRCPRRCRRPAAACGRRCSRPARAPWRRRDHATRRRRWWPPGNDGRCRWKRSAP